MFEAHSVPFETECEAAGVRACTSLIRLSVQPEKSGITALLSVLIIFCLAIWKKAETLLNTSNSICNSKCIASGTGERPQNYRDIEQTRSSQL